MAPAQVPKIAPPSVANFRSGWNSPSSWRNFSWVVLSPPGRTRPSKPSSAAAVRTSLVSTPSESSMVRWASKSPWTASTPIFIRPRLPAARLEQFLFVELADIDAAHGFAELFGGFEYGLGVLVVCGGLDDGASAHGGIRGLEDSRADEDG